ncbi:MAG: hypothetical protein JXL97_10690 [Bacteroidales bacterium]|nr:hypothetical protein [Bacteroidales bacterium]
MARLLLLFLFLLNILLAKECNQVVFEEQEKGLALEMALYDKSIHIAREMYKNNKLTIRKTHYKSDMEFLENRLHNLNQSKKYLSEAMQTNFINTEKWRFLASVCSKEYSEKIEKELIYAKNAKEGMEKVAEHIKKMIDTTESVINIGKKKYSNQN